MLEILFIFGLLGLLTGTVWEYLSALAAFPTILAAMAAVPLIASADYLSTIHHLELGGLDEARKPIPPRAVLLDTTPRPTPPHSRLDRPAGRWPRGGSR